MDPKRVIAVSAFGVVDSVVVALHQTGLVRRLPDPPLAIFDSNRVTRSPAAYPFGIPDATLAILQYGLNIVLAAAAHGSRRRRTWLERLLRLNVAGGALGAAYYLYVMIRREKKLCVYCLGAIAASFALVPLTRPGREKG
jgi:uncharacterized membrane protein